MRPDSFNELPALAETDIQKSNTELLDGIPTKIKLAVSLWFLTTACNYTDLKHLFHIHKSMLSQFAAEVCEWNAI